MRALFLSAIIFFLIGKLNASSAHILSANTEATNYIEKGPASILSNFPGPEKKKGHNKRKAAIGLIACITLGPVGYLGVRLFSHKNPLVLKRAKLGLEIWIALAAIALIILLIVTSKGSGMGSGRGSSAKSHWQAPDINFSGGISPNKRKREQLNPQPPVIQGFPEYIFF